MSRIGSIIAIDSNVFYAMSVRIVVQLAFSVYIALKVQNIRKEMESKK